MAVHSVNLCYVQFVPVGFIVDSILLGVCHFAAVMRPDGGTRRTLGSLGSSSAWAVDWDGHLGAIKRNNINIAGGIVCLGEIWRLATECHHAAIRR